MTKQSKQYKRIVAKFGTNLLTNGTDSIDMKVLSNIVRQAAGLRKQGREIALVSSGAVASGKQYLKVPRDKKDVPMRQVMAAVGQHVLMNSYTELFRRHGIVTAQALLTKLDLADRLSYLNARNTLLTLLELGVVPVINENDVVAIEELEGAHFGDNDNLSGMVANLIDADLLVIMSDVAGLYDADPAVDKKAKLIPIVKKIDKSIEKMAGGTRGRGTGGMTTKIQAAKLATASGTTVVIAGGSEPDLLPRLIKGESVGTMFLSASDRVESRKRWILSGLATKGRITVDKGAAAALSKGNKSLLPAGVRAVEGGFKRGDAVDITTESGERIACGISNYAAADVEKIKGARSDRIEGLLGYGYGDEVVHRDNIVVL
ncbi:MAG: glutamate 5-kinase [Chloroflexota bacterium]|nr:glutamate 5-kinase [Chloroflexota bacterium]